MARKSVSAKRSPKKVAVRSRKSPPKRKSPNRQKRRVASIVPSGVPSFERLKRGFDSGIYDRGEDGTKFMSKSGVVYCVPAEGALRYVEVGRLAQK